MKRVFFMGSTGPLHFRAKRFYNVIGQPSKCRKVYPVVTLKLDIKGACDSISNWAFKVRLSRQNVMLGVMKLERWFYE